MPIEALVSPLPRELTTPPVTNMCFVMGMNLTADRKVNEGTLHRFAIKAPLPLHLTVSASRIATI